MEFMCHEPANIVVPLSSVLDSGLFLKLWLLDSIQMLQNRNMFEIVVVGIDTGVAKS